MISFVFLAVLLCLTATSATDLSISSAYCSGFSLDSYEISCDGTCGTFDPSEQILAPVTFPDDLEQYADIVLSTCYYGFCYAFKELDEVDLCSAITSSDSGSTCPESGTYTISTSFTIPGDDSTNWLSGQSVGMKAAFYQDGSSFASCKATVSASDSSYSWWFDYGEASLGIAAVVGLAIGAFFVRRHRRRHVATISNPDGSAVNNTRAGVDEISSATNTEFIEMSNMDDPSVGAVV